MNTSAQRPSEADAAVAAVFREEAGRLTAWLVRSDSARSVNFP